MIDEQNNLFDFSVSAAQHVQAKLLTIEDERIYVRKTNVCKII